MASVHSRPRPQTSETADASQTVGLRAFLKQQGWHFHETSKRIEGRLRRLMGNERYADWLDITDQSHAGKVPTSALYNFLMSRSEAITAMSHQAVLTEKCFVSALTAAETYLTSAARVADMGCYVGDTTRWLALRHPLITIVGIDQLARLLDLARPLAPPNCRFVCCDYRDLEEPEKPFDVLVSSLGIDFPSTERADRKNLYAEDPCDAAEVQQTEAFLQPVLEGWRRIARPGTVASAVFRIPTFEAFLGFSRAAAAAGWALSPESLRYVDGGADEHLPAFVLIAGTGMGRQAHLDVLLRAWVESGSHVAAGAALLKFRALKDRREIARVETRYDDGHVLVREVGAYQSGGYIYDYATTLYRKLQLVSLADADPERVGMKVIFGVND